MKNMLYLHGQGCGGDTISLLNAEQPDFAGALDMLGLSIAWHPSLYTGKPDDITMICEDFVREKKALDFLLVEGSIPLGPDGSGSIYEFIGKPFAQLVRELAAVAFHTVAIGTCAAWGGIPGASGNPTGAVGLQYYREKPGGALGEDYRSRSGLPVTNVPGCPTHPDWIIETLYLLSQETLHPGMIDHKNRARHIYSNLAHTGCVKNEFYEFKASAEEFGQLGCLFEKLGCRGTQCESDCNVRLWLGRTGSCTKAGFPCISCTSQTFPNPDARYFATEWVANVPKFLPRDVPKAWYIGMVGLSKMATPERLKVNAVSTYNRFGNGKDDSAEKKG